MTSFESFPPAPSEQALSTVDVQRDRDLAGRAALLSELHATRLLLSRTEQMLEQARLEQASQAALRRAYEEARASCARMESLLQAANAEADRLRAEQLQAAESLRQIQASTYWRIGLRLKALMARYPLLRRIALRIIRLLRR